MKTIHLILIALFFGACQTTTSETTKEETNATTTKPAKETITTAYGETFKELDFSAFNKKITALKGKTAIEIMKIYHPHDGSGEGRQKVTTTEKKLDNGHVEVQLIHENILDDSVDDIKFLMTLKPNQDQWVVIDLKQNFRCHKGRGHQDWSAEPCR